MSRATVPIGHSNVVVAGLDGSDSAVRAVRWAAVEAGRRGAVLRIVHAELPLPADALDMTGMARSALHDEATAWVRKAVTVAQEVTPAVEIDVHVKVSTAAWLLEQESRTAALVVVGSRGLGGFTGLLLGSVAVALASSAKCSVVVVRGEENELGPVVVGVNGSPENWFVLDRAFEEAEARGVALVAVHVWRPPLGTPRTAESVGIVWSELDTVRDALVAQRLAACADRHPDVVLVERHVVHGSAAQRLVEQAAGASLLVVDLAGPAGSAGCCWAPRVRR